MINDLARRTVSESVLGPADAFRRPLYDSYCFSRLPGTLEFLLTGEESDRGLPSDVLGPHARRWERVALVLADGFGWHLAQQYVDRLPFLRRFFDSGLVSPITSQFPSTTAAHMTTLHTGRPSSQTGVWEWYYYEPVVDEVILPLPWSPAGMKEREGLASRGLDVSAVLPGPRWYADLARRGVRSAVFQNETYAGSTYSTTMFQGADRRGFADLDSGLTQLSEVLCQPGPLYAFFYIDLIDGKSHSHGLDSPEFAAQVEAVFRSLEEHLWLPLAGRAPDTLLLLSADHGHTPVDLSATTYINLTLPDLLPILRTNGRGDLLRFAGSARDLFLYVKPERLAEAEAMVRQHLLGKAEVWRVEAMLAEGLFGPSPSERLLARLGNLAILPYAGQAVFWFEEGKFAMKHKGAHGGLTPQEMDTGLYVLPM